MKKAAVGFALATLIVVSPALPVNAQTDDSATVAVNDNTNASGGVNPYFHAPATLAPLLLLPLAGILYLLYEKISKRQ